MSFKMPLHDANYGFITATNPFYLFTFVKAFIFTALQEMEIVKKDPKKKGSVECVRVSATKEGILLLVENALILIS